MSVEATQVGASAAPVTTPPPAVTNVVDEALDLDSAADIIQQRVFGKKSEQPQQAAPAEATAPETGGEPAASVTPEGSAEAATAPEGDATPGEGAKPDEADATASEQPAITSFDDLSKALEIDPSDLMSLKVKTKIDGRDGEATLAELVKSYQIEGYLTQKGQKLSDEQKAFERQKQEVESAITQRVQQLEVGALLMQQKLMGQFSNVNWEELRQNDPVGYSQKWVEWQQASAEMQQVSAALNAERQRAAATQVEQHKSFLAEQKKLFATKVPEWNDEKIKKAEVSQIRDYLKSREIDPKELNLVADHRYALIIRDATKWWDLQEKSKQTRKAVAQAPKVVKPTAAKPAGVAIADERVKGLKDRLRKTGSADAAADLIFSSGHLKRK